MGRLVLLLDDDQTFSPWPQILFKAYWNTCEPGCPTAPDCSSHHSRRGISSASQGEPSATSPILTHLALSMLQEQGRGVPDYSKRVE